METQNKKQVNKPSNLDVASVNAQAGIVLLQGIVAIVSIVFSLIVLMGL